MYKNCIHRTSTDLDLQSLIRRCEIAYDQRARYVEFVCNIWNEGRFGPDLAAPVTVTQHDRPEPRLAEFYDPWDAQCRNTTGRECARRIKMVRDAPILPSSAIYAPPALITFLGRASDQAIEAAFLTAMPTELFGAGPSPHNSTSALTPNQGRGSP